MCDLREKRPGWPTQLLPAGVNRSSDPGRFSKRRRDLKYRQPDFKCCAAFRPVIARDLSLVILNYSVSRAKTKTRTFAHRFRRIERIENALGIPQARTGVRELHSYFIALPPERNLQASTANCL